MRALRFLKNQKGQMMVQVLITAAIMGIIMMAIATMMNTQSRTAQMITQKLGVNDLQQMMLSAINSGGACQAIITALGSGATFNTGLVGSATPPAIPIPAGIPLSAKPGAAKLVTPGSQPSALTNNLVVSTIRLVVISGSGTQFRGNIEVAFDESKLIVPLRPAAVGVILQTNATGTILSCKPDSGASSDLPGAPCTLSGDSTPKGVVTYSWSTVTNVGSVAEKQCCKADPTNTDISYGAYKNGGLSTFILACTPFTN